MVYRVSRSIIQMIHISRKEGVVGTDRKITTQPVYCSPPARYDLSTFSRCGQLHHPG